MRELHVATAGVGENHNIFRTELAPFDGKSCGAMADYLGCERRAAQLHDLSRTPAESKAHPDPRQRGDREGGGNKSAADAEVNDETGTDQTDVTLTTWPGGEERVIATAGYHGRPVRWRG